jgi:uncharacterized membrane protein YhaH (DUF805 family)
MEQARKNLKITSIAVLAFAGVYLLRIIAELCFGDINNAAIPEDAPDNILLITKTFLLVFMLLLLLPQIHVGIRGLRVAKVPDSSKGHIVWGIILLAFAVLNLIEPVMLIIRQGNVWGNVMTIVCYLAEVIIYSDYVKYARLVAKGR